MAISWRNTAIDLEIIMKKLALVAALPVALTLAACGESAEEVDGTDTTAMEPAAVEPMDQGMTEQAPMADDTMSSDAMGEDGMMADDAMTETPETAETPM
ncbi:MAG: hypothetical protein MK010_01570 [Erythrobacter sp.]|nr:hypothetical protein [Erythrobacter sp.]